MTTAILMTTNNAVLITAAGSSQRFGEKKEYLALNHDTHTSVLSAGLYAFVKTELFNRYVITVPQGGREAALSLLEDDTLLAPFFRTQRDRLLLVEGGKSRQESVYKGLLALADKDVVHVFVHDGARPWVPAEVIAAVLEMTRQYGAAVPTIPVTDTQKEVDDTGKIVGHLRRNRLAAVQTPQGFLFDKLLAAHRRAEHDGIAYTDDSEIYAHDCGEVYTCPGARENRKITYPEDLKDAV